MRKTLLLFFIIITQIAISQTTYQNEIKTFQKELNKFYSDPEESPLGLKDLKSFQGHPFFPINKTYRVNAQLTKIKNPKPFKMQTSTLRKPTYVRYAYAEFKLKGNKYKLALYRKVNESVKNDIDDHLFLPFTDLTNGLETYGGGRYIDLKIPEGNEIIIDFNKAYQPYCAYSYRYSCPVPPAENELNLRIEAGVQNL
ncbi:DUF1684 domain-containing protein [Psychroflexus sp. ALD_RP9]|uniref:DUF1684 domain-containing protein n=1 Tax=Psychroflexus sp. ALD_RP9 TaxID=2777186 RepID=UPI001A8D3B53|nr:DUF1684 domain-containing protein [Psychroflexus sp. ALD_RP9]QSS96947.1 DUF1684 domain-containing protein [Psychroflexus sp. ALD_RP9]